MRDVLKRVARGLAFVAAVPSILSWRVRSALMGRDRALEGSTQALALLPGVLGQYIRRAFLSQALDACHPTVTVCFGTVFSQTRARLDEHVYVGPGCHLGWTHLEKDVLVAAGVHIPSGPETHGTADPERPIREQPGSPRCVRVGAGSWIGSAAVVLADVGPGSVVAAGSVVIQPVPPRVIAAGVPARVVRDRTSPTS